MHGVGAGWTFDVKVQKPNQPGFAGRGSDGVRTNDGTGQRTETERLAGSAANSPGSLSSSSLAQRVGKLFPTLFVARCAPRRVALTPAI